MKEIIVNKKYDGKKLNTFLLDSFNGLTLNILYKTLRKKDIRINGIKVSENVVIHVNDHIQIYLSDNQLIKSSQFQNLIDIVYEDENIIVVNKPARIEVLGENSLTSYLQQYCISNSSVLLTSKDSIPINSSTTSVAKQPFLSPCHRLDRNTTGLILFAKNEEALHLLLDSFKKHEIEKHYHATVIGIPKKKQATLIAYLFKDAKKSFVYISDTPKKGYEKIITSYNVLSINMKNNTCLLDVTLHTGKTHQIRAHLAHIGHPIVGDGKYGNGKLNKKLGYKTQQLCSYSLTFHFNGEKNILNYLNKKTIFLS